MTQHSKPHLTIGYWLKKADELLTARINEAQAANGLSRTEWQLLNTLPETQASSRMQIIEMLRPFADADVLHSTIDGLIRRGLVVEEAGTDELRLSSEGTKVHAAAFEVQKTVRRQAVQGISEADYLTTIRVLQTIVENLSGGDRC